MASWGPLGRVLGRLGAPWDSRGPPGGGLGASWARLGGLLESFLGLLDGSWGLPGAWEGLPEGLMGAWRPREGEKKGPGGPGTPESLVKYVFLLLGTAFSLDLAAFLA